MKRTALIVLACCATACVGGDDDADSAAVAAPTTAAASVASSSPATSALAAQTTVAADTSAEATVGTVGAVGSAVPTTAELVDLPEVGVPGLDSDDAFCAAWSRWAGSYQVLLVANAFGTGGADALASLEVVAAPVLVRSSAEMVAAWPEPIVDERELAADRLLGPITRRLTTAADALAAAGADDEVLAVIDEAWLAALAERDPSTPDFAVELPDEVWAIVDAATVGFSSRLVPFAVDPSLVTDVETPLTDAYLAVSCPDQGTLSGQEIDPGATVP